MKGIEVLEKMREVMKEGSIMVEHVNILDMLDVMACAGVEGASELYLREIAEDNAKL